MKKIVVTVVILLIGLAVINFFLQGKPQPEPQAAPEIMPPKVAVISTTPKAREIPVRSQGIVKPRREIDLVAEVMGRVLSTAADYTIGGEFKKGDILLRIDPSEYQIALVRAESRVAEAQEKLATEQGRAIQAKREWRDLGNTSANALFLREPQIATAKAQLKAAKAELQKAKQDLAKTELRAPFDGRIREVKADLGQYLNADTPVARVYATKSVQIRLPLTDRQLESLPWAEGEAVLPVKLSAIVGGEHQHWQGAIKRLDGVIDEKTRLSYAIAEVDDPFSPKLGKMPLRIGQFVDADISGKARQNVLEIPAAAIRENNTIWTAKPNSADVKASDSTAGQLHIQSVHVLYEEGKTTLVQWPNDEQQWVVTSILGTAKEAMPVLIDVNSSTPKQAR